MSNHLHVVLRVDIDKAKGWSEQDVLIAWHRLFKGTKLTHRFVNGAELQAFELITVRNTIEFDGYQLVYESVE